LIGPYTESVTMLSRHQMAIALVCLVVIVGQTMGHAGNVSMNRINKKIEMTREERIANKKKKRKEKEAGDTEYHPRNPNPLQMLGNEYDEILERYNKMKNKMETLQSDYVALLKSELHDEENQIAQLR